jgi:hypothetical protein
MLRRYLVALVGALAGAGLGILVTLLTGVVWPRLIGLSALGGGALVMAFGERLGLVPASHEVGQPTSLFTDEKGRRR